MINNTHTEQIFRSSSSSFFNISKYFSVVNQMANINYLIVYYEVIKNLALQEFIFQMDLRHSNRSCMQLKKTPHTNLQLMYLSIFSIIGAPAGFVNLFLPLII